MTEATVKKFKPKVTQNNHTFELVLTPQDQKNLDWPYYLKGDETKQLYWDMTIHFEDDQESAQLIFEMADPDKWDFISDPAENKGIPSDCVTFLRDANKTSMTITVDSAGECVKKLGGFKFKAKYFVDNQKETTISSDPVIRVIKDK